MLTHPTLDQLRALKLDGMVQAFVELAAHEEVRNLAHAEWLALLLDREAANRNTRRFQTRLRAARLRHSQAAIEDVDYRTPRRLDKALFQQLTTCRWIAEHRLKWQLLKPYEKFAEMIDRLGTGSLPTASPRTRSRSASSRASITKSV